jgi:hypothetical protein
MNGDSLFDYAEGQRLAGEGMARALDGAGPAWPETARDVVLTVGRMRPTFTSDDVWEWMATRDMATPGKKVALGPVMRALAVERLIIPTGDYRNSARPETHTRPLRVWRLA